ncbi:MAG: SPOR domain-containing protein [Candidatus Accumulibacter sp.]|uniref:SPOR domain-containing protein n=1 Tax=Accumulibacter sp. TaxID=2053492 RepID=UPI001AD16D3A|nr:SPOR domain-containing protein [Accumulibacter sp.]MBN8438367.1 SPOR domain-containing protein [Accumulibacter sp.]
MDSTLPMTETSDPQLQLKKRARRRLVGAVAFAGLAAVVLPMVMDEEPKQQVQDVQIRIPGQDQVPFKPKELAAKATSATSEAAVKSVPDGEQPNGAAGGDAPPKVAAPAAKVAAVAVPKAGDKPAEKKVAKPAENPPEKAAEKKVVKPVEKVPEKVPEKAAEKKSTKLPETVPERSADKKTAKPPEALPEKVVKKEVGKPVDRVPEKPLDKKVEKTAEKAVEKAAEKAPVKKVDKPAEKSSEASSEDAGKSAAEEAPHSAAPPTSKSSEAPQAKSGGQQVIVIGAFTNPENVKQLQGKISSAGVNTYTEVLDSPDGKKTRVRAGPFPNREAADKALEKLKRIGVSGVVAGR